jgi:hypothetical protein
MSNLIEIQYFFKKQNQTIKDAATVKNVHKDYLNEPNYLAEFCGLHWYSSLSEKFTESREIELTVCYDGEPLGDFKIFCDINPQFSAEKVEK